MRTADSAKTGTPRGDVSARLAGLVGLAAEAWGDDSVASGWLARRARLLLGVELDTRTAFGLILRARGAAGGRG